MIYLDFIESVCFSIFLYRYFKIESRYEYIVITTLLQLFFMQAGNILGDNGVWLTLTILSIMISSLIIYYRKINFNYFYIPILYNLIIFITCYLGLLSTFIIKEIFTLSNLYLYFDEFLLSCYFSKFFLVIITYILIKYNKDLSLSFEFKEWNYLVVFFIVLILNIGIVSYSIFTNEIEISILYIILIFLILLVFLFVVTIYNVHKLNKNKIEYAKLEQIKKFNEEKYKLFQNMKYDLDNREHRLFYILIKIKNSVLRNDMEEILKNLDKGLSLSNGESNLIDTSNDVFDYILNLRIREFKEDGMDISVCAFISKKEFYDNLQLINLLMKIIDVFKKCKILKISMNELNDSVIIKFCYLEQDINEKEIDEILNNKMSDLKYIYKFKNQKIHCLSMRVFF